MVDLLAKLKENPFVLAPMAGITDPAFRSFMKEQGCSVVITELVSANGLKYNSAKTEKLMRMAEMQRPVGIQLFGETPEIIAEGAKFCEDFGADFIDLNFGCPVKKVVKKGAGSAVLRDLPRLSEILQKVRASIGIPLTIKIRTGWDNQSRNAAEVARIAYNEGVTWVAIHGRTRSEAYTGKADWDYIHEVKQNSPLPILGNGDISSPEVAVDRLRKTGCDGVMIGRGCLKNPFIFLQALDLWNGGLKSSLQSNELDYSSTILRLSSYLHEFNDDRLVKIQLRKLSAWFSTGFPGSAAFRKGLYSCEDLTLLKSMASDYFGGIQVLAQKDTSGDAFLMGGHG